MSDADMNSSMLETPKKRKMPASGGDGSAKKARSNGSTPVVIICSSVHSVIGQAHDFQAATKIASCVEELSASDRLILNMKTAGKSWQEITQAWQTATGIQPSKAFCSTRYHRLKASLDRVDEKDIPALNKVYEDVWQNIEREKAALDKQLWNKVASEMESSGMKYAAATLEKCYKAQVAKEP